MTKINGNIHYELSEAIRTMAELIFRQRPCATPPEQILDMILSDEDKFVLTQAKKIVGGEKATNTYAKINVGHLAPPEIQRQVGMSASLFLTFANGVEMMLPSVLPARKGRPLAEEPEIAEWLTWRLGVSTTMGAFKFLIDQAYNNDHTLEQLRYMIPGVVMLCKRREGLGKFVDRLQTAKTPTILPRLGPTERVLLGRIAELMGVAALLDMAAPLPPQWVTLSGLGSIPYAGLGTITLI